MIDLRGVISSFGGPLIIDRRGPGIRVEGVGIASASTAVTVVASVQPAGANTSPLPEGVRVEDVKIVYCTTELRTASDPDGNMADRFDYEGRTFEVFQVDNWSSGGQGQYFRAMAARIRDRAQDDA